MPPPKISKKSLKSKKKLVTAGPSRMRAVLKAQPVAIKPSTASCTATSTNAATSNDETIDAATVKTKKEDEAEEILFLHSSPGTIQI